MDKLVLFDIDQTLLEVSQSHILSFSLAFKKVYGVDTSIEVIRHQGMTDPLVIIETLKVSGLDDETIKSKMDACIEAVKDAFFELIGTEKLVVLEGIKELLEELEENNILMGIVTGNLEEIARFKLRRTNLLRYFKVGGFGSDDIVRANLIKIAMKRAESLGFKYDNNVFVIGDSARDIEAAKGAGVKSIGVATGNYSKAELKKEGADFVLDSLRDKEKVLEIIS